MRILRRIHYAVLSTQVLLFQLLGKAPVLGPFMGLALFLLTVLIAGGSLGILVEALPRLDPGYAPHAFAILLSLGLLCMVALLSWKILETSLFLFLTSVHWLFGRKDAPKLIELGYAAKRQEVQDVLDTI